MCTHTQLRLCGVSLSDRPSPHTRARTPTRANTRTRKRTRIHCVHDHIDTCIHMQIHAHTRLHTHTHTHTHMPTYRRTDIHTNIHTDRHTYIYAHRPVPLAAIVLAFLIAIARTITYHHRFSPPASPPFPSSPVGIEINQSMHSADTSSRVLRACISISIRACTHMRPYVKKNQHMWPLGRKFQMHTSTSPCVPTCRQVTRVL